ncbi:FadR/GntR family transcriptional regulator [Catenuloplanes japonicus]|uniref:FadR/GntR family transcriptional regulator n=1 Tax=Catenuloplanes japonicus TaxID=33876 RepID=UPI0005276F82|nr:FadR/GntR family transcriptional regulator [Catenuloplanes japonicus]
MTHGYRQDRLHGRLVHDLGARIVRGELRPGAPLPTEEKLAAELGLSRSAVREAFRVLAAKGLVVAKTRVGTLVQDESRWSLLDPDVLGWRYAADPTDRQLDELSSLRSALEPEAARLAATVRDRAPITAVREAYERMAASVTRTDEFIAADLDFHRAIVEAGANQLLVHLNTLMSLVLAATREIHTRNTRRNRRTLPQHLAVLEAIEARDPALAASLMHELVEGAQRDIRRDRGRTT